MTKSWPGGEKCDDIFRALDRASPFPQIAYTLRVSSPHNHSDAKYIIWSVVVIIGALIAYVGLSVLGAKGRVELIALTSFALLSTTALALLGIVFVVRHARSKSEDAADMRADFVTVASHELRSPLTAVRWKLAELRSNTTLSPDAREITNDLYLQICRLIDLTTTFLLMTSVDKNAAPIKETMRAINVVPVLRDSIARAQGIALPKKIRVEIQAAFDLPIILRADPLRLRMVFDNLLSNAIKYSPEGSTVSFSYIDDRNIKRFKVHDMGIGVPKDELKKIFTGYHRASNAKRSGALGSGFGLYMVKKIVDLHRGTIVCESEEGHGTTFTVTFPSDI